MAFLGQLEDHHRKRRKPERIISKLRQVEVLTGAGHLNSGRDPLDRRDQVTYHPPAPASTVKRPELEVENTRLTKAVSRRVHA